MRRHSPRRPPTVKRHAQAIPEVGGDPSAGAPSERRDRDAPAIETLFARYRGLIDDWPAFCRAMERPLAPVVRANTGRIGVDELAELVAADGYGARPLPWQPGALEVDPAFRPGRHWGMPAGLFQVQEAASLLPVTLLDVRPGQRVLDLCAAPGNKSVQIADALAGAGTVVANDASPGRIGSLNQAFKRHGVFHAATTLRDGQGYPPAAGTWDRILVDAPCSCEGTYRKGAHALEHTPGAFRDRLVARQKRLLQRALRLVRPGGRVVYSTCTFAPEENEGVVAAALAATGGGFRIRPAHIDGLTIAPGLTEWDGQRWDKALAGCARLWPHHNDTSGFFAAVIERSEDAGAANERPGDSGPPPEDTEAREHLLGLREHFGLPEPIVDRLRAVRQRRKYVDAVGRGIDPPPESMRLRVGIPAVGVQSKPPKPATATALALGPWATRHLVDVDAGEADAFLQRRAFPLAPERQWGTGGRCHVLVRYRGYVIGVGEQRDGYVASLFPKGWVSAARTGGAS